MKTSYMGKIARINLTTGQISVEPLDYDLAIKFIGGRGLGTAMLYEEGIAKVDPLSPENKLIYINGPMTGTASNRRPLYGCDQISAHRHDCKLQLRRRLGG